MYAKLPFEGEHCRGLATLLVGTNSDERARILTTMLGLPLPLLAGAAVLGFFTVATGAACATLHHAALTGFAIRNFGLESTDLGWWDRIWFRISSRVERVLRVLRVSDLFQPLGASHWLVLQKAAVLLQRSSEVQGGVGRVARVYVDVIQGDELGPDGKVGVLYTGTVKQLVCETDGNVVFLLLTEAKRWSKSPANMIGVSANAPAKTVGRWKPLDNSEALGLDGRNIRNVSFRLIERSPIAVTWPAG
ncbi:MAG: hypothetical protein WAT39_12960 [Planctomycetota bacterium]